MSKKLILFLPIALLALVVTGCAFRNQKTQIPDSEMGVTISSDECTSQGGAVEHYDCSEGKAYLGTIYDVKDVNRICCKE